MITLNPEKFERSGDHDLRTALVSAVLIAFGG